MIETYDRGLVHAFFKDRLGLHESADFRGVLYAPNRPDDAPIYMNDIAVAVAYTSFIGRTCCMHTVVQRPDLLNRRMVIAAFQYPFNLCGCEAVIALVDTANAAAIEFNTRLGFKEIARIPNGAAEGDMSIMQMMRADCRWLRLH